MVLFFLRRPLIFDSYFCLFLRVMVYQCELRRKKKIKSKNLVLIYTKVQFVEGTCNGDEPSHIF